ncbi:DMT family transporter [Sphingomonas rubra]|uniref:Threonine/homoserine efflux transporter RhtA n=1 Tax=Sphingomonas rubra TaxID=634430 RepID=A0A1I5RBU2_9SPHN|nr:DMT family transporter [Sphingomonas rubra]SFP55983.1 Threonine/homoserine efflux transporter RhtA [Sphingomonas rubra]
MQPAASPRKTPSPPSERTGVAFAALIVANVALAFGPLFVRLADTGPVAAGFWRITLAAPMLCALALAAGARPARLSTGLWATLAFAGIAFAVDLGSWHLGILRTTLANATLFGNCATLIFPIYGFLVARAWPTRTQGGALLLAALGAGLLMGRSYQLDPRHLVGDLLCLAAGILYTVYFIAMARARAVMAPLSSLALSSVASILPLLAFAWMLGERIVPTNWTPLIGVALVAQVLGQGCMIYALGKLTPLVIGIALLIQPVVAGAIGWIMYDERLGAPDLVGVAMVAVALVLVRRNPTVAPAAPRPHLDT